MITTCQQCGGLRADHFESFAGTPCRCHSFPAPGSVSDTPRTNAVLDKPDNDPHLPTMLVELTIHAKQLEREVFKWKHRFIPFACVHAGQYGKEHYGKEGCLHFTHYDLLKEAGARMDDFTRCGDSQNAKLRGGARGASDSSEAFAPSSPAPGSETSNYSGASLARKAGGERAEFQKPAN